ncbi:MAG: hypothetical protein ACD_2C00145G0001 [uncultured bacterium (gcode 4)]|uniref:Glycosyltransferase n=1 Tax=uncultured bacterium (gcode 4) TaxID=1234023 RepID=K2GGL9_9BACT|nr:MAG: hypothetical protein ACD_2C00145G0001 [uncultured bacterium (gcode 4)]
MKLAYVIYTYDRIHDALVQMEIVRHLWAKKFTKIEIIHVYNWNPEWYSGKTLEDHFLRTTNPGHFEGAANLIDIGVEHALNIDCDYVVVSAADTWMMDADLMEAKINQMRIENKVLLTCPWGNPALGNPQDVWFATDFFVFDAKWERKNKMFPLKYADFKEKYIDLLRYLGKWNAMVERVFFSKYLTACSNEANEVSLKAYALRKYLDFKERTPVHYTADWDRTSEFPKIWLYMNHSLQEKRKIIQKTDIKLGKYAQMLKDGEYVDPTGYIV